MSSTKEAKSELLKLKMQNRMLPCSSGRKNETQHHERRCAYDPDLKIDPG